MTDQAIPVPNSTTPNLSATQADSLKPLEKKPRPKLLNLENIKILNQSIKKSIPGRVKTKEDLKKKAQKFAAKDKEFTFKCPPSLPNPTNTQEYGKAMNKTWFGKPRPDNWFYDETIAQVINEIHPDVRKFFNSENVASYKSTADGLIIKVKTGITILVAHWKDRKKHYIVKQGNKELLNVTG